MTTKDNYGDILSSAFVEYGLAGFAAQLGVQDREIWPVLEQEFQRTGTVESWSKHLRSCRFKIFAKDIGYQELILEHEYLKGSGGRRSDHVNPNGWRLEDR